MSFSLHKQAINIIVLILARSGFNNNAYHESLYQDPDHRWLTAITFGGYCIILGAILATYLLGDSVSDKLVCTKLIRKSCKSSRKTNSSTLC